MHSFRFVFIFFAAGLSSVLPVRPARSESSVERCTLSPAFAGLRAGIAAMPPGAALTKLYAYRADDAHDPNICDEGSKLEHLIDEREKALIWLVDVGGPWRPDAVYRCGEYSRKTTECNGAVADMTAHPYEAEGGFKPAVLSRTFVGRIHNALPGARLVAVYHVDVSGLVRGEARAAVPISSAPLTLAPPRRLSALVAILTAPTAEHYRKIVWYFR